MNFFKVRNVFQFLHTVFIAAAVSLNPPQLLEPVATVPDEVVVCDSTQGEIHIEVFRSWAPLGADRFLELVRDKAFFKDVPLYRAVKNFLVQFGIPGEPANQKHYPTINDDPLVEAVVKPFRAGTISFAGGGHNSRTTEIFIAYKDSQGSLGTQPWETPFARVTPETMNVVNLWYTGYGDLGVFGGKGPDPGMIHSQGAEYIRKKFPKMDFIKSCFVYDDMMAEAQGEYHADLKMDEGENEEEEIDDFGGNDQENLYNPAGNVEESEDQRILKYLKENELEKELGKAGNLRREIKGKDPKSFLGSLFSLNDASDVITGDFKTVGVVATFVSLLIFIIWSKFKREKVKV